MTEPMFTIKIGLKSGPEVIHYSSFADFHRDNRHLGVLFDEGLVESCAVYCGAERLSGLGRMRLEDLCDQVISSSTKILREYFGERDHG